MKKVVLAAVLSVASVNAFAASNALDGVRDNLKDLYDNLGGASTWTGSTFDGKTAISELAQYGAEMQMVKLTFDPDSGFSLDYTKSYNEEEFQGLVNDLENGVLTDVFGSSDLDSLNIISADDSTGVLSTGLDSEDALLHSKLDTELGKLNDAMATGNLTTIGTAMNTFETNMGTFNTEFTAHRGTDLTTLKNLVVDEDNVNARSNAISIGVRYHSGKKQYLSGTGTDIQCYASYADYANGNSVDCK